MAKNNATCKVCGTSYRICGHCPTSASLSFQPWRRLCDTPDCYGVYLAVQGYNVGQIDKDEAKKELLKFNVLSKLELETFDSDMKKTIEKIMSVPNVDKKKSRWKGEKKDDMANDLVE